MPGSRNTNMPMITAPTAPIRVHTGYAVPKGIVCVALARNIASLRAPRSALRNLLITSSSPCSKTTICCFHSGRLFSSASFSSTIFTQPYSCIPLTVCFELVIVGGCHDATYLCHNQYVIVPLRMRSAEHL